MPKRALTIITDGVEEIEAVAPVDILNRAGVEVVVAGIKSGTVTGAYGSNLVARFSLDEVEDLYDAIILPGGATNAKNLASNPNVIDLVKRHYDAGRIVAAICASPSHALVEAGIIRGKRATGDPGFNDRLAAGGAIVTDELLTIDGNIVTAMGPGAALEFGLMVAELLVGKATADRIAQRWRFVR